MADKQTTDERPWMRIAMLEAERRGLKRRLADLEIDAVAVETRIAVIERELKKETNNAAT